MLTAFPPTLPAQSTNTSTSNTVSTSKRLDVTEGADKRTEALSDSKKNLALRFKIYEASQKDVTHVLSCCDRVQGVLLSPLNQEEAQHQAEDQRQRLSSPRSWKGREKEHQERLEKERLEKLKALEDSRLSQPEAEGAEGSAGGQDVRVPCLDIQVLSSEDVTGKILESSKLPAAEQVKPCEAQMLSLPWSGPCCVVSHQVTMAQSLVQDDVPQGLCSNHVAGEVLSIP